MEKNYVSMSFDIRFDNHNIREVDIHAYYGYNGYTDITVELRKWDAPTTAHRISSSERLSEMVGWLAEIGGQIDYFNIGGK